MTRHGSWLAWLGSLESDLNRVYARLESIELKHTHRILATFQEARVGQDHFIPTTGYGYHDRGRETLERVYAQVFGAEAALVRQQIVSGTHAINLCLQALCGPGDEILFAGAPYDTLQTVAGLRGDAPGSLRRRGVAVRVADLPVQTDDWASHLPGFVTAKTSLVYLQRSGGYSLRPALTNAVLARIIAALRDNPSPPLIFVDNCYGEFTEAFEPTQLGADLMAGSLIKNPGGGLVPGGGYIVGRKDLVDQAAARLYAPGLAGGIGPSLIDQRLFFQGLFCAPHLVGQALRGAILCARAMAELGWRVSPLWDEERGDIVQRVIFGQADELLTFCRAVQRASPVEAHAVPEPAPLPGYTDEIIMAGGTFIQGSSSELTVDAPLREPFAAFWQGGLHYSHAKLALANALSALDPDERKLAALKEDPR